MAQPMYQQIADDIRRQIEAGELSRGKQLPTELELREKYGASRNTVRDAIKLLAALGLVETRPGQGTFITRPPDPFVTILSADSKTSSTFVVGGGEGTTRLSAMASVDPGQEEQPSESEPVVRVEAPDPWLRRRLSGAEQVIVRSQRRHIGSEPWALQKTYYPMEFFARGATRLLNAENIKQGAVAYLAEVLGVMQTGYRDWITARRPKDEEQAFFGVAPDSTVLEVTRTAFDQDKKPFRVTMTVYPAERNQFIYDFGDGLPEPQYDDRRPRSDA